MMEMFHAVMKHDVCFVKYMSPVGLVYLAGGRATRRFRHPSDLRNV